MVNISVFFRKFNETRPLVLIHDIRGFMTDIKLCLLLNPNFEYLKKIKEITAENLRQNIGRSTSKTFIIFKHAQIDIGFFRSYFTLLKNVLI